MDSVDNKKKHKVWREKWWWDREEIGRENVGWISFSLAKITETSMKGWRIICQATKSPK